MGLVRPLVVLALLSWVSCDEPAAWEVPPPTNVVVTSYNFNTSLHWDYKNVSVEPLFTVEITCHTGNTKYVVNTCVNISLRYCDLTHKISPTCAAIFWAGVKAVSGLNESSYARSKLYRVFLNSRIGPPKLRLSLENDEIIVVIDDPLTPYFEDNKQLSVRENISDFSYAVFMWPRENSSKIETFLVNYESCGKCSCTIILPVQTPNIEYCISAKGTSEEKRLISCDESNESCITPSKHSLDLTGPISGGIIAVVVIAVILAIVLVYICSKRPNVKLPKSLATVVSIKPSEIKPESQCSVSIYKPVKPQCEDEDLIEHTDPIEELKPADLNCGKEVNTDDPHRGSSKAGDTGLQDGTAVEIPEDEHSLEANDNYSKSISGQEEPCDMLPSLDLPRADVRKPTNIGICRNISGYDKPHWRDSNPDGEAALVV